MKPTISSLAAILIAIAPVAFAADDSLKQVQQALRQQGYYYGEMDGKYGDETEHAIRRFQIRSGLKVTGQLDGATRQAILSGKGDVEPSMPGEDTSDLRAPGATIPKETIKEDKDFLNNKTPVVREKPKSKTATLPVQPAPSFRSPNKPASKSQAQSKRNYQQGPSGTVYRGEPGSALSVFRDSPYERASRGEQRRVLTLAQHYLSRYRYYRGPIDGVAGPGTVEGIRRYQQAARLRPTGRLDGETLELMGMLPARREQRRERYYVREVYEPYYEPYYGGGYYGGGFYVPAPRFSYGWGFY